MTNDHYKKALEAARAELADLTRQKDEMEKRIAQLRQTVMSLAAISEEDEDGEVYVPSAFERNIVQTQKAAAQAIAAMAGKRMGFSDVCRDVLKADNDYMTPVEVRDALVRMGIDLETKYTNALAVIHRTLGRLYDSGEIEKRDIGGKTNYRWKSSVAPRFSKKLMAERKQQRESAEGKIVAPLPSPPRSETDNPTGVRPRIAAPIVPPIPSVKPETTTGVRPRISPPSGMKGVMQQSQENRENRKKKE